MQGRSMTNPMTITRLLMSALIEADMAPMRSKNTPSRDGTIGDPYARGYLESADACLLAITEIGAENPDAFIERIIEQCQKLSEVCPSYVQRGPDGTWLPGSPYDHGRVDGALKVRKLIADAMKIELT
jgi:hypothetical protein